MSTATLHVGIDATSWINDRGYGRFTRELVTTLAARDAGFRYTLLFDQPPDCALPRGVETICVNTKRSLSESSAGTMSRSIGYLWKIGKMVGNAKFDMFFFPTVYSYFPIPMRVPCIVCFHDTTAERFPELLFPTNFNHRLWQIKSLFARFQMTRAMTVSQASAFDLERMVGIPTHKIDVVTEAADPVFRVIDGRDVSEARARYGIPNDSPLLVHVGGLNRHKNVLGLLRAMPAVISKNPAVQLAIVGDTSNKGFWNNFPELQNFVETHPPLDRHVHFTGYIDDPELAELLNSAEALIFPSLWEGFGLPAVEAMSCGIPVLASRHGSLPEVVGDAGLFFDPLDPAAITDCILQLLSQPALQDGLRENALKRARSFRWERAAELAEVCFHRCHADAVRRRRNA